MVVGSTDHAKHLEHIASRSHPELRVLLSHYSAITRVCGTDLGEFQGGSGNNSGGTASGEEKVRGGLAESFDPSRPVSGSRPAGGTARPDGKPLTPALRPAAGGPGNPP